jgi:hypothetical protein
MAPLVSHTVPIDGALFHISYRAHRFPPSFNIHADEANRGCHFRLMDSANLSPGFISWMCDGGKLSEQFSCPSHMGPHPINNLTGLLLPCPIRRESRPTDEFQEPA